MKNKIPYLKELKYALATTFMISALLFMTSRIINAGVSGGGTGGASAFTDLTDAPATYEGQSGKVATVKGTEDGLEFTAAGTGDMTNAVEGAAIADSTTTLRSLIDTLSTSTNTIAGNVATLSESTTTLNNVKASTSSPTFTGTATFNGDIESTGTVTANRLVLTGTGQASLPQGLIGNEDGGSTAESDLRWESDTEANMIWVDAGSDLTYLGGSTNGLKVAKGGTLSQIGTSSGTVISGLHWEKNFDIYYPSATYTNVGSSMTIIAENPYAVLIDSISVICAANPTTELLGEIYYCDAAIGWDNPVLLNDFNTTDGVRKDNTMTAQAFPANKKLFIVFHAQPEAAMTQVSFTLKGKHQ